MYKRQDLVNSLLSLQRFDETRQIIHEVQARKLDNVILHNALYALAFLGSDSAAMAEQQQWFAGKPEENIGLALASDTEAYGGHLRKARELTKQAADYYIPVSYTHLSPNRRRSVRGRRELCLGYSGNRWGASLDFSATCFLGALSRYWSSQYPKSSMKKFRRKRWKISLLTLKPIRQR